jgi:hypothetical protein
VVHLFITLVVVVELQITRLLMVMVVERLQHHKKVVLVMEEQVLLLEIHKSLVVMGLLIQVEVVGAVEIMVLVALVDQVDQEL